MFAEAKRSCQLEVEATVSAASKVGIALSKVPVGLVSVFKEACTFCDTHAGAVKSLLGPANVPAPAAVVIDPQAVAREGGATARKEEGQSKGQAAGRRGKGSVKPVVEVRRRAFPLNVL